jgi:acetyl esterase/lipase
VVSPGYRLALAAPYPAALDDCYAALLYMKSHAAGLGIRLDQIVGDGEPFYAETVRYIENLRKCGIPASVDVYHSDMHAFDMMQPDTPLSREAAQQFHEQFAYAQACYFAPQGESER